MKRRVSDDFDSYLSGSRLYGNDFTSAELEAWFADEADAYAMQSTNMRAVSSYEYHALNLYHSLARIQKGERRRFRHVCGFGSAYCHELVPILDRIDRVTVVDSASAFSLPELGGLKVEFIRGRPSGKIDVPDEAFDLITCFGVLHHIPNVGFVLQELARTLRAGGLLLVREPTSSMGDWRLPRPGLTPRERGIPRDLLSNMIRDAGLVIDRSAPCMFPPLSVLCERMGVSCYSSRGLVLVDAWLSRLFSWNYSYHRTSFWRKFAPSSQFVICRKR